MRSNSGCAEALRTHKCVTSSGHCKEGQGVSGKLHCVSKKVPTFKLSVTLSNLNQFLKVLHC